MLPGSLGLRLTGLFSLVASFLFASPSLAQHKGTSHYRPVASYNLRARLDTELHRVNAEGTISFTNASQKVVTELWFHLFPNAFSSPRTRFCRTVNATRRSGRLELHQTGRLEIAHLSVVGADDSNLWLGADPTSPGDPDDTTDRRVPLASPLMPGATLSLNVKFTTELPFIVERMGWVEDFYAVAQWFPKLARLEPDGTWHHFAYEALGEFSADFGDYDVTVDLPDSYDVAAPGQSSLEHSSNGRKSIHYRLQGAHDFAWFAWNQFKQTQRTIAGIQVQVYSPAGHGRNVQLELEEINWGLANFQKQYGPYPYDRLVVVHPPDVAIPAGGMEYPGLIVTGGPWYLPLTGSRALNAVTLHELAHQWFYGVIATDEVNYPVLDEGLTSWIELNSLTLEHGAGSAFSLSGFTVSAVAITEALGTRGYESGPLARPSSSFKTFLALTHTVYARTALLLQTLANVYGYDAVQRALRSYALEYRYAHPTPDDLVSAFVKQAGQGPAANLATALNSDGWVDFTPTHLVSRPISRGRWLTTARIQRNGTLSLPVDVAFSLANGRTIERHCGAKNAECTIDVADDSPATSLLVDPHQKIVIESTKSNNAFRNSPPATPWSLIERLTYFIQLLVGGVAS